MISKYLKSALRVLLPVCLGTVAYAQADRATVTGIVHDASGATVPAVAVTVVNTQTGIKYNTETNDTGYYSVGSLPVGGYQINYIASGFKELTRSGLTLTAGQVARADVQLDVGEVSEKLTVTGEAPLLQTEVAQASKAVGWEVFKTLPLTFGSGGRNMTEFAASLVPGVSNTSFNMRIQGTPGGSQSTVIDGMNTLSGYLPGDFAEQSVSPEAVAEMTVYTGNVNADVGRGAGGAIYFNLKSGTNQVHGSGLYYLQNEFLNANDWNNNLQLAADPNSTKSTTRNFLRPRARRSDGGGSFGGPVVIPKVYDGRNKTFFYVALERMVERKGGPTTLSLSVPLPEMWNGNLSRLLGKVVATDALGRNVAQGQIYDPTTLRQVNGQYVADPFLGNIIPVSRFSKVAQNIKPVFAEYYPPAADTVANNLYNSQANDTTVDQDSIKIDHSFSSSQKVSGFANWYASPRFEHGPPAADGGTGIWSLKDDFSGGPLSAKRIRNRSGYSWNVSEDWIVSPRMLNHASFGVNVNFSRSRDAHVGQGLADQWGIKGVGLGLPKDQITAPVFALSAGPYTSSPVVNYGYWGGYYNKDDTYRAYIFSDVVTMNTGAHTLKAGFEWSRLTQTSNDYGITGGLFNFSPRTTGVPGQSFTAQVGHSFASFLLGQVDSAYVRPVFIPQVYRTYASIYVQDSWKVTPRMTLNAGLRWSGNTPVYESQDRMATFNTSLPDPTANNLRGVVEYMGSGSGRSGRRAPAQSDWKDFGPTFGLAYRFDSKSALRLAYGISFTPESLTTAGGQYTPIPGGFSGGLQPTNSVPADSKGIYLPVFQIDDGYPGQTLEKNLDPAYCHSKACGVISPDIAKAGYVQHVSAGVQREVRKDLLIEVEWRASKGSRLHMSNNSELVYPNQIRPEYLSKGAVLGQVIDSPEKAAAAGLPYPYAGWSGLGANTLSPFPQVNTQRLTAYGDTVGFTTYHSANLIVTKRMAQGFHVYGAYTFSKAIGNVLDIVGGSAVPMQDTYNRPKQLLSIDRTHFLKSTVMWELPMGRNKLLFGNANRVLNALVGGWTVSALLNYSSGAPLGAISSRSQPVGWNGPGVFANFKTPAGGFKSVFNPATFNPWNANDPGNRLFDPTAFSDALPQQLGNAPPVFPQVRMPWTLNENGSVVKSFQIHERFACQIRLDMFNLLNRHYFGAVDTNMNNSYFGNIRTASGARTGQFGLRLNW